MLVIDDDPAIRAICAEVLRSQGYEVDEAATCEEARRLVADRRPQVLLVDVQLPDGDGFALLESLAARRAADPFAAVFLSARGETADKVRGLKLGADDYLTKPFDAQELVARIDAVLRRREAALGASPMTQLPGGRAIDREVERRLDARVPFALSYVDLDNLKAYNDTYGYAKADGVVLQTAGILREAVACARRGRGRSSGTSAATTSSSSPRPSGRRPVCAEVIAAFDRVIPLYYDRADRERGAHRRGGPLRHARGAFPILSISIATVQAPPGRFPRHAELARAAAELKDRAKRIPGSVHLVDGGARRRGPVTLQRKLALFVVAAALAPLVGVAFAVLRGAQDELARRAAAEHLARARGGAVSIAAALGDVDAALAGLAETWRPDRLREDELRGMLVVLSRQVPAADASAIVDGAGSARAVLARAGADAEAATEPFVAAVRASASAPAGRLVLRAYDDAGGWQLAAVRAVPARAGGSWLVAVRLGPDVARRRLDAAVPEGGAAYLLDGARVLLASTGAGPLGAAERAELAGRLDPARAGAVQGERVLGAFAPLDDGTGWGVLVVVPAATAYAPIVSMRRGVLAASAGVLALVLALSFLIGRRTVAGLARIESAARALGGGELAVRLPEGGADEVAQVSRTFNAMAGELQRARERLERWNEELQREVEARARELKIAQAQLVETQKLAALGQLGAGVAHEINNPLTGILGNAQLLLEAKPARDADREPLEQIELLARRCRDITQNLLRFSQQRAEPDFQELDLNRVVRDALALAAAQLGAPGSPSRWSSPIRRRAYAATRATSRRWC